MSNLDELRALLQYLISPSRRRKIVILIKEFWLGIPLCFRKTNQPVSQLLSDLPDDEQFKEWSAQDVRRVDASYWKRLYRKVDDRVLEDGVHGEYHYTVHKLFSATSYTNETTHRSIFTRQDQCVELFSSKRGKVKTHGCMPP